MVISQSRCPTFNLNYMLCKYFQLFIDKINKCESRMLTNARIFLFKKFFIGHSTFYKLKFRVVDKDFQVAKVA